MGRAATGSAVEERAQQPGVRDVFSLGAITPESLRATFAQWRIFEERGSWWAMRGGPEWPVGPRTLLLRVIRARDLSVLAERLCLQEYLDRLDPQELAAVYRNMTLPTPEAAG